MVMACWPGPYTGVFNAQGFPGWAGPQPAPSTYPGWRAALLAYHTFALAGYLTVAAPNVWMQYQALRARGRGGCGSAAAARAAVSVCVCASMSVSTCIHP